MLFAWNPVSNVLLVENGTAPVDESAGRRQSYVEDCQVCCKPNVLRVEYDNSSQEFFITAELE